MIYVNIFIAFSIVAKIKQKKRHVPRLQKGASENKIVRWAKTHDVFDRLDAGVSELVDDHRDLGLKAG